ncbi:VanZ family protein [Haloferax mediterranei ATCC 33500]|nr:VanZ family protein [Haloferax mediterranei]MDX5989751.1 VanZ family protein [Haloferax mediterranei ATCC 33500]
MRSRFSDSRWMAVAGSTIFLFVLSMLPSPLKRHPEWKWIGPDKVMHLVGHAGYAVLIADAFRADRCTDRGAAVLAVCISTTHSLVTGRAQNWVPGREFEFADVVASLLGALFAVFGWYVVRERPLQ